MMTQLVMFDYNGDMPRRDDAEPAKRPSPLGVDPVGMSEIGERLGVRPQTVAQWHHRGLLPPERWRVSGRPAWNWPDIERWWPTSGRAAAETTTRPKTKTKTSGARTARREGTRR